MNMSTCTVLDPRHDTFVAAFFTSTLKELQRRISVNDTPDCPALDSTSTAVILSAAALLRGVQTEEENGPDNQLINSVYLDNSSMELYHGRLDKKPNALAIRIRYNDSTSAACTTSIAFDNKHNSTKCYLHQVQFTVGMMRLLWHINVVHCIHVSSDGPHDHSHGDHDLCLLKKRKEKKSSDHDIKQQWL